METLTHKKLTIEYTRSIYEEPDGLKVQGITEYTDHKGNITRFQLVTGDVFVDNHFLFKLIVDALERELFGWVGEINDGRRDKTETEQT